MEQGSAARMSEPKVKVKVVTHQAYDLNLKVQFLPATKIPGTVLRGCQPRQGGEKQGKDALDLPEPTRKLLELANVGVLEWLAQSSENVRAFTVDPISALNASGVAAKLKWDRSQLKNFSRLREAFGQAQAVQPGLQIRKVEAVMNRSGKVDENPYSHRDPSPKQPTTSKDKDCNCNDQKKGQG